jgi:hypothetical protein
VASDFLSEFEFIPLQRAPDMNTSVGISVIEYFQHLSEAGGPRAPADVLREVASLFAATELGLGSWHADTADLVYSASPDAPPSRAWRTDAQLLERVRVCWTAQAHTDAAGHWLISLVAEPGGEGRLAWVHRPGQQAWTDSEKVLWMFAAQALVRWLRQGCPDAAAAPGTRCGHHQPAEP